MVRIVGRSEWGARFARGAGPAPLPAERLYLHHAVTPESTGPAIIRQIEGIGQARFGAGCSYTFMVTVDGTAYEGHGVDRRGAHTKGFNSTARAICAVGNFDAHQPPAAMLEGIAQLVAHGHREGWWPDQLTGGHRDAPGASTACPGGHLYAKVPTINARARQILAGHDTPEPPKENFDMDSEARAAFAALNKRLDKIEKGHGAILKQIRAWVRVVAELVAGKKSPAELAKRADELNK